MITITQDEKKRMIQGYNSLVEDYLQLNIGDMPFVEASYNDVEALFIFQNIIANELMNHWKEVDLNGQRKVQKFSKGFSERKQSSSTTAIAKVL